jgi:hypothetical protein
MMDTKQIKANLQEYGFVHILYPNSLNEEKIKAVCGDTLFKTLVKENPNSTRLLASNQDVDFHTDHIKAKYIAWQCNSQAALGGESILMDTLELLSNTSKDILDCLESIPVKSHRLFFDDKPQYPLFSKSENVLYYAPFLCDEPINSKEKQAYSWFINSIKSASKIEIKLSEGDWLIIDNHRMLHGRKGFEKKSNRLLTRYWLSGQAI